ncbi:MAG: 50S ribosomal protein L17 [Patescibacteria group bacterium]
MRKLRKIKKFGRIKDKREQMIKSLANSLVFYDKIETTVTKAKVLKSFMDRLVTKAKQGTLHDRRQIMRYLDNEIAVKKLMEVYGPKYKDRSSGFTRLTKTRNRVADNAPMILIEFI